MVEMKKKEEEKKKVISIEIGNKREIQMPRHDEKIVSSVRCLYWDSYFFKSGTESN